MTYFQCSVTGKGNTVIVTCDSAFAGSTVTLTNGTKTYMRTCPSSSPYEIEFHGIEAGTWTVSAIEGGVTYSATFLVKNGVALLAHGFNWRTWVYEGGLDPDDYTDLDDVFDDEPAVRRLMLVHDSADYLIACVTEKLNDIDAFCANGIAMKWIGLCDYVCDGLESIDGVVAKFLASTYWERYLKDHVPVMTSNSAPYGTIIVSSTYSSSYPIYYCFDGNDVTMGAFTRAVNGYIGYTFTVPTMVKKVYIKSNIDNVKFFVQASNDGSTWTTLSEPQYVSTTSITEIDLNNEDYYRIYRVTNGSDTSNGSSGYGFYVIQLYGRAMSVSVPSMTSYTVPYGEVVETSHSNNTEGYKAFNLTAGTWFPGGSDSFGSAYVGYVFPHKVKIEEFLIQPYNSGGTRIPTFKISASNDPSSGYVDIGTFSVTDNSLKCYLLDHEEEYKYYRFYPLSGLSGNITNAGVTYMNFYGKDYSEKEFESGTTRRWFYDHGVELETINVADGVVKNDDDIYVSGTSKGLSTNLFDMTYYDLVRLKLGDNVYIVSGKAYLGIGTQTGGLDTSTAYSSGYSRMYSFDMPYNGSHGISSINEEKSITVVVSNLGSEYFNLLELWLE